MLHLILAALLLVQSSKDVASSPLREANDAAQEDWITKVLHYIESNPETLEELMSNDYAVLEGDILLLNDRNAVERVWPSGEIPFTISPEKSHGGHPLCDGDGVRTHVCVVPQTNLRDKLPDLLHRQRLCFVRGLIGGEQPVFVGPQCMLGNIVHEILHALGFHHEHTRSDRDQTSPSCSKTSWTNHKWRYWVSGKERNFQKQSGETFDLEYNAASIMHYG
ncbi:hypothetical protein F7725_014994, partial [Dissostichus mawsoni]